MFPKMNPKQLQRMMRQMGVDIEELDAEEVVIKLSDKDIVLENPSVNLIKAKGQKTYQITGDEVLRQAMPKEDIKLVSEQAKVSEEEAEKALQETKGDLAKAIMHLGKTEKE
ncbi:MAG: nascent polypeptide-associated complex protein [Thermodesulfobacteriota bacterium]